MLHLGSDRLTGAKFSVILYQCEHKNALKSIRATRKKVNRNTKYAAVPVVKPKGNKKKVAREIRALLVIQNNCISFYAHSEIL